MKTSSPFTTLILQRLKGSIPLEAGFAFAIFVGILICASDRSSYFVLTLTAIVLVLSVFNSTKLGFIAIVLSSLTVYRYDIGVGQLSPYRILISMAFLRLLLEKIFGRSTLRNDKIFWLLILMILWDSIGIIYSTLPNRATQLVKQQLEYPITYFVVLNVCQNRVSLSLCMKGLVISIFIAVGFGIYQWLSVFVFKIPFEWPLSQFIKLSEDAWLLGIVGERSLGVERAISSLGDPISFSNLLAVGVIILLAYKSVKRTSHLPFVHDGLHLMSFIPLGLMLFASGSRQGIIAAMVGGAVFLCQLMSKRKINRIKGLILLAVISLLIILSLPLSKALFRYNIWEMFWGRTIIDLTTLSDRFGGGSFAPRVFSQLDSIKIGLAHPLLGTGTGSIRFGSHGQFVDKFAENGIIGLIILLLFYYYLWKRAKFISGVKIVPISADNTIASILSITAIPLFTMWLFFSFTYGYWFQPFYIIIPAFISSAYYLTKRGL